MSAGSLPHSTPGLPATNGSGGEPAPQVRTSRPLVAACVAFVAVSSILYWDLFQRLIERWNIDPNCSHGMLVLPACGVFMWRGWCESRSGLRKRIAHRCIRIGSLSFLTGMVLHVAANAFSSLLLGTLGLAYVVRGVLWLTGGPQLVLAVAMPSAVRSARLIEQAVELGVTRLISSIASHCSSVSSCHIVGLPWLAG